MNRSVLTVLGIVAFLILIVVGAYAYRQQRVNEDARDGSPGYNDRTSDDQSDNTPGDTIDNGDDQSNSSYVSEKGVTITVDSPARGAKITSPLSVKGSVPGNWSFEAQFTVRLLDENGTVLAEDPATLQGDWMTEEQVPFTASVDFSAPAGTKGTLELVKANPSDLPENSDKITIPVAF